MSDTNELLAQFKSQAVKQLTESGVSNIDDAKLDILVGRMRPVIANKDATLVSGTDPSELETVRKNFVVKHLGIEDMDKAMTAIKGVVENMSAMRMKNRAAFYYMVEDKLS